MVRMGSCSGKYGNAALLDEFTIRRRVKQAPKRSGSGLERSQQTASAGNINHRECRNERTKRVQP